MLKNVLKIFLFSLISSLMVSGCDSSKLSKKIVQGTLKDGLYSNDYFKMSIKIPPHWDIQNSKEMKELMNAGAEIFSENNPNFNKTLEISQKRTVNLITAFKYKQTANVEFSPSITIMAENLSFMPNLKKGADYLFHVKQLLKTGQLAYEFPKEIYSKPFSGLSFDILSTMIKIDDTTIYQDYHATKINNYMLTFVTSYTLGEEEKSINEVLDTLTFSK